MGKGLIVLPVTLHLEQGGLCWIVLPDEAACHDKRPGELVAKVFSENNHLIN